AVVRLGAAGAIAVNVSLQLIELWRVTLVAPSSIVHYAVVIAVATMALHLRHVVFGLRNERPPSSAWTFAALAIANLAAAVFVGRVWALQFAPLAVSTLIVVRGTSGIALVGAILLAPLVLSRTTLGVWQNGPIESIAHFPTAFLALAIAWRTVTLYVPVRLVAMIQQLEAARRSLESRAVIQARTRIERDLRSGLELALQRIISGCELAAGAVAADPVPAPAELRALVTDSRRALADARRIAAGYRTGSLRAELDAATALLQAAGSTCRVVVAPGVALDNAAVGSTGAIRAAVVRALENDDRHGDYEMLVELDGNGGLRVVVSSETRPPSESTP